VIEAFIGRCMLGGSAIAAFDSQRSIRISLSMALIGAPARTSIKLCAFGLHAAGKSSLIIQMIQGVFIEEYDPTIEDEYHKQLKIDGQGVSFDLLDTAGMEEYMALYDQWMRRSDAFMAVYSIAHPRSLARTAELLQETVRLRGGPVVCSLIGTKADLDDADRRVTEEEGRAMARSLQESGCSIGELVFFETSARTRMNVEQAFEDLARRAWYHHQYQRQHQRHRTCTVS